MDGCDMLQFIRQHHRLELLESIPAGLKSDYTSSASGHLPGAERRIISDVRTHVHERHARPKMFFDETCFIRLENTQINIPLNEILKVELKDAAENPGASDPGIWRNSVQQPGFSPEINGPEGVND